MQIMLWPVKYNMYPLGLQLIAVSHHQHTHLLEQAVALPLLTSLLPTCSLHLQQR